MTGLDKSLMVAGWNMAWLMWIDNKGELEENRKYIKRIEKVLPVPHDSYVYTAGRLV